MELLSISLPLWGWGVIAGAVLMAAAVAWRYRWALAGFALIIFSAINFGRKK